MSFEDIINRDKKNAEFIQQEFDNLSESEKAQKSEIAMFTRINFHIFQGINLNQKGNTFVIQSKEVVTHLDSRAETL